MKKLYFIIIFLLLLASCDQVIFSEPQPARVKALKSIPEELQGEWLDQNGDTLYVFAGSFIYHSDDYILEDQEYLSDSAVLKAYKGKYFYSRKVEIDAGDYWLSYILDTDEELVRMDLYAMDPGDIVKLAKLQEITSKVMDIEEGEINYYLFAPKRRHYKKIIADTIFTKMISFTKIKD